jgi:hypothetical protein
MPVDLSTFAVTGNAAAGEGAAPSRLGGVATLDDNEAAVEGDEDSYWSVTFRTYAPGHTTFLEAASFQEGAARKSA